MGIIGKRNRIIKVWKSVTISSIPAPSAVAVKMPDTICNCIRMPNRPLITVGEISLIYIGGTVELIPTQNPVIALPIINVRV